MGNATRMGMMGAALGALQFLWSEDTRVRNEQAELVKLNRLRELDAEKELRANAEWERRHQLETESTLRRDQILQMHEERELGIRHKLGMEGRDVEFAHDLTIEELRTTNRLTEAERQAELQRRNREHEEELVRTRPVKPGSDPTAGKGILGDDGKTYPYGTELPAGVKPAGGYGISWAPSASKGNPTGAGRPAGRSRPNPRAASAAGDTPAASPSGIPAPKSQAEYAALPSGTTYMAPDGTMRVKP